MKRAWDSRFTGEALRDDGGFSEGKLGKIFFMRWNLIWKFIRAAIKITMLELFWFLRTNQVGEIRIEPPTPRHNNAHIFTLDHTLPDFISK